MNAAANQQLELITEQFEQFGKEHLEEVLYALIEGAQMLVEEGRCRIYLEDLTLGALACVAATGGEVGKMREKSFPINDSGYLISQAYQQQEELAIDDLTNHPADIPATSPPQRAGACYLLPISHLGRPIGVLCLDRGRPNLFPTEATLRQIRTLLGAATPSLNRARKYHQRLLLARRVDQAKKHDAALFMVQSAAHLIDQVALASMLIPVPSEVEGERTLQILASYSKEPEAGKLYEQERLINLAPGESLISRFIDRAGVIVDDRLLSHLYLP
jgi:GAF domain-containing protein